MRELIFLIPFLFAGVFASAQTRVRLNLDGRVDIRYENQIHYFRDSERRFLANPDAILQQNFVQAKATDNLNMGYSSEALWIRFRFEGEAGGERRLILSMKQPTINRVTLYKVVGDRLVQLSKAGGAIPSSERSFNSLGLHLPMGIPDPGVSDYVLCLEPMGGVLDAAFSIVDAARWVSTGLTPQLIFQGLFFGLLISLMLSNAITWYLTGKRVHIYYVAYVGCMVITVANMEGLLDWILPWSSIGGWLFLSPTFSACVGIALFLMLTNFYAADREFPRIARIFYALIGFNSLAILLNLFGQRHFAHIMLDIEFFPMAIVVMASAFHIWKSGFRPALYMILARVVMLSFTGIYILKFHNIVPSNLFTDSSFYLGTLLEMIIVYLGLAVHMKHLETEKDVAQKNEQLATVRLDWFDTLVRVITHDMSTPISIISTSVDLELRRQQPSSSLKRNLERIQRAVNQQGDLIGHVREMIAVTTGKKTLNRVPIHLQKQLEGLLLNFSERMETKQVKVQLDTPTEPLHVLAESTALEHTILANFLSNAIKFSIKGSLIRVTLQRDHHEVVIRFEDQGIGIPEDIVEKLFDPTKATSRLGTDNESGTGFGLPIAKVYIEQFQGSVTVQTRVALRAGEPSGTVFEIRFPLCESSSQNQIARVSA